MFYAHYVLSKKAPLAKIWLAAHWEKKLSKANIFDINIESSVENVLNPQAKMALRTSGHLMLGIVRVHNRKAKYLLADCNEAYVKIKMAFRPGQESLGVDLPESNSQSAYNAVTLPEVFNDFDTSLADFADFEIPANFTLNQSRVDEITLKEDLGTVRLPALENDGFGDGTFDDRELLRNAASFDAPFLNLPGTVDKDRPLDTPMTVGMDGFGDIMSDAMLDTAFDPPSVMPPSVLNDEPGSMAPPSVPPPMKTPLPLDTTNASINQSINQTGIKDQTTLIANTNNAFILEPLEYNSKDTKMKKKRKLLVDENIKIQAAVMKSQMEDTNDIVTQLDLAPPTKKLMLWKETGNVEKLFSLPGRSGAAPGVHSMYGKNLKAEMPADMQNVQSMEYPQNDDEDESVHDMRNASRMSITRGEMFPPRSPLKAPGTPRGHMNPPSVQSVVNYQEQGQGVVTGAENVSLNMDPPTPYIETPGGVLPPQSVEPPQFAEHMDDFFPGLGAGSPASDNGADMGPDSPDSDMSLHATRHDDEIFNTTCDSSPNSPGDATGHTAEEQEERRWNRRTQQMVSILGRNLMSKDYISFKALSNSNNRKQAAAKFYTLLVLRKHTAIEVDQIQPFSDIIVSKGQEFNSINVSVC